MRKVLFEKLIRKINFYFVLPLKNILLIKTWFMAERKLYEFDFTLILILKANLCIICINYKLFNRKTL